MLFYYGSASRPIQSDKIYERRLFATRVPREFNGKKGRLQQIMLGLLDTHMQKNEGGLLSHIIYKINSKWVKELSIRHKL